MEVLPAVDHDRLPRDERGGRAGEVDDCPDDVLGLLIALDRPRRDGGVAHRHTHPGPGIRYLLRGELEIETEGRSTFYGPGGAWFEGGPEPVVARASSHLETSFVRVLVLPAEWAGKRTIRYVEAIDETAPKQSATVYLEHAIALPL